MTWYRFCLKYANLWHQLGWRWSDTHTHTPWVEVFRHSHRGWSWSDTHTHTHCGWRWSETHTHTHTPWVEVTRHSMVLNHTEQCKQTQLGSWSHDVLNVNVVNMSGRDSPPCIMCAKLHPVGLHDIAHHSFSFNFWILNACVNTGILSHPIYICWCVPSHIHGRHKRLFWYSYLKVSVVKIACVKP